MVIPVLIPIQGWCKVTETAVIATVAPDYSSGAHSVAPVDPVGGPRTARNNLLPTAISDISLAAYENFFYRIERYQADNITKFDISAPETPIWQFSTLDPGDTGTSNPYDLIFLNAEKAYLLRYNKTKAWIVNPSAVTQAAFKIGELDLSSYADSDGIPEMNAGVIANGKLFITLQRMDQDNNFVPTNTVYVAVFDTASDTEVDTGISNADGVKGIPLPIRNPGTIQYVAANKMIYVQGVGDYGSSWAGRDPEYSGGIVSIHSETYSTAMVLDDGDAENHPYGNISGMAVISAEKGYFVSYAGWGDNTLYAFNPSTGVVSGPANDALKNKNITGTDTGTYRDKNGMLWVCNATDAEVVILNTVDNTVDEKVSTNLSPRSVVFALSGIESQDGGYVVSSDLWLKSVLKTKGGDINLVWKSVGEDMTPAGDKVVSGFFYADPKDFAYGSSYNPEVFVKIYIAVNGWTNIAFNHVTVDDVDVYSAHGYEGSPENSSTITLKNRLAEHGYTIVK
jgi:hypothetical protein